MGVGDTFGEEALISETRRNATVTMLTDGSLMRLGKEDFKTLLNEPMLDWVSHQEARQIVAKGGKWLDVRLPSEFEAYHETGAINIPLYFIRLKLGTLDPSLTYVVCCDTGRRSSAGAFILNERGFDTRVLRGGLQRFGPPLGNCILAMAAGRRPDDGLHRVRRLVPAEGAGQIVLDLLLGGAAVLIAELDTDARRCACPGLPSASPRSPFRRPESSRPRP